MLFKCYSVTCYILKQNENSLILSSLISIGHKTWTFKLFFMLQLGFLFLQYKSACIWVGFLVALSFPSIHGSQY